jgi:hypothetical protein
MLGAWSEGAFVTTPPLTGPGGPFVRPGQLPAAQKLGSQPMVNANAATSDAVEDT